MSIDEILKVYTLIVYNNSRLFKTKLRLLCWFESGNALTKFMCLFHLTLSVLLSNKMNLKQANSILRFDAIFK